MGWNAFLEDALKRVFEQHFAPASKFSLDVLLFYASVVQLLAALCYYVLYKPDATYRWEYGKLKNPGMYQGCSLPHSVAWMLFESPSLLIPLLVMAWTRFCHGHVLNFLILLLFAGHYLNRSIIYPLLDKKYAHDTPDRNVPLPIVLAGLLYTSLNGMLQSLSAVSFNYHHETRGFMYLYAAFCQCIGWEGPVDYFQASQASAQDIVAAARYAAGIALFLWGMWTNIQADLMLVKLRGMRHVVEKCEYSVPLPSTKHGNRKIMAEAQECCDTIYDSTSAAQRRKRSTERTAFRDQQCTTGGLRRKSATGLITEDAGSERLEGREISMPGWTLQSLGRGASAKLQGESLSTVHHCFTRNPASAYKIPRGQWCDHVSCPNYFGEICEWVGFAIASDTYAAFSFAFFTIVFLTRRALIVHKWYIRTFGKQYPQTRNAVFPGVL